ncbi:MAG TPA: DUF2934 domain-containing protein [Tepidisphaeraceae bacterium]|jgi:hypothetical protein|nr:DUF2934 domain-containing protein [Tepidisphaeraceae bacterium]
MAKKTTSSAASKKAAATPVAAPAVEVTPVRNSAVPPKTVPAAAPAPAKTKAAPTYDAIALSAYFIWKQSGGSEFDNWIAAERQLRSI